MSPAVPPIKDGVEYVLEIWSLIRGKASPITANRARVQRLLGPRLGKDVQMITLTVDPVNDTRLRALAMAPPENLAYAVEHLDDETH